MLGEETALIALKRMLAIVEALKPSFIQDGNRFCVLYGTFPYDCVVGFGETAFEAMQDFANNFYSQKAVVPPKK